MKTSLTKFSIAASLLSSGLAIAAGGGGVVADPGAMQGIHFDPKGKAPSS